MDEESDWKHPNDVMKIVRAKKKALQARFQKKTVSTNDTEYSNQPTKRKNPFSFESDHKKQCTSKEPIVTSCSSEIFSLLSSKVRKPAVLVQDDSVLEALVEEDDVTNNYSKIKLSIDWTLKTKLRLISENCFPWGSNLKSSQESSGITSYTRCLHRSSSDGNLLDSSFNAQFHEKCLYWQHPSLPWLNLYPRFGQSFGGTKSLFNDENLQESLLSDWSDSLRSLYQLVRVRQCPYFYVCCHIFTCLFRAAGICGIPESHVLVTPTNKGIRNVLKSEDIEFQMPFMTTSDAVEVSSGEAEFDDDNTNEWLESMGIESKTLLRVDARKQKNQSDIDKKTSSVVLISGGDIHAFYNFLLNTKITIPNTGPLAGVPPTLLSPVAFMGGILKPLKVRQSTIQADGKKLHSVDIEGPILPDNYLSILELAASSVQSFNCKLKSLPYTASFNIKGADINSSHRIFAEEALSDCGLSTNLIKKCCDASSLPDFLQPCTSQVQFKDGSYSIR